MNKNFYNNAATKTPFMRVPVETLEPCSVIASKHVRPAVNRQPGYCRGAHRADPRSMIDPSSLICSFAMIYRFLKGFFATSHICHFLAVFDLGARAIDGHSVNRKICAAMSFTKRSNKPETTCMIRNFYNNSATKTLSMRVPVETLSNPAALLLLSISTM